MTSQKLEWIDVVKGLGIISVVAGHIYQGGVKDAIFMFHMPLFFFISGYLYTIKDNQKTYFFDKAYHLLVPYVAFLVLLYIPKLMVEALSNGMSVKLLLNPIIGGRALSGELGVFWFVTCLFFSQQVMNWLFNRFSIQGVGGWMLVFLGLSYVNALLIPAFWLPGNINVIFAACPFFFLGYLARKIDIKRYLWACLLLAGLAMLLLFAGVKNTYEMKYANYGIPVVTFLSALCVIATIFMLAEAMAKYRYVQMFLGKMGAASMVIMFLHQPIQLGLLQFGGITDPTARFFIAALIPLFIFALINRNAYLRAIFLGSKKDFNRLLQPVLVEPRPQR